MIKRFYNRIMEMKQSFIVTLPIEWVRANKLSKKDTLVIEIDEENPKQLIIKLVE